MTCPTCGGNGHCRSCGGNGQQDCPICGGSGWKACPDHDPTTATFCPTCGTWGRNGMVPCPQTKPCDTCKATGNCHRCGGSGEA